MAATTASQTSWSSLLNRDPPSAGFQIRNVQRIGRPQSAMNQAINLGNKQQPQVTSKQNSIFNLQPNATFVSSTPSQRRLDQLHQQRKSSIINVKRERSPSISSPRKRAQSSISYGSHVTDVIDLTIDDDDIGSATGRLDPSSRSTSVFDSCRKVNNNNNDIEHDGEHDIEHDIELDIGHDMELDIGNDCNQATIPELIESMFLAADNDRSGGLSLFVTSDDEEDNDPLPVVSAGAQSDGFADIDMDTSIDGCYVPNVEELRPSRASKGISFQNSNQDSNQVIPVPPLMLTELNGAITNDTSASIVLDKVDDLLVNQDQSTHDDFRMFDTIDVAQSSEDETDCDDCDGRNEQATQSLQDFVNQFDVQRPNHQTDKDYNHNQGDDGGRSSEADASDNDSDEGSDDGQSNDKDDDCNDDLDYDDGMDSHVNDYRDNSSADRRVGSSNAEDTGNVLDLSRYVPPDHVSYARARVAVNKGFKRPATIATSRPDLQPKTKLPAKYTKPTKTTLTSCIPLVSTNSVDNAAGSVTQTPIESIGPAIGRASKNGFTFTSRTKEATSLRKATVRALSQARSSQVFAAPQHHSVDENAWKSGSTPDEVIAAGAHAGRHARQIANFINKTFKFEGDYRYKPQALQIRARELTGLEIDARSDRRAPTKTLILAKTKEPPTIEVAPIDDQGDTEGDLSLESGHQSAPPNPVSEDTSVENARPTWSGKAPMAEWKSTYLRTLHTFEDEHDDAESPEDAEMNINKDEDDVMDIDEIEARPVNIYTVCKSVLPLKTSEAECDDDVNNLPFHSLGEYFDLHQANKAAFTAANDSIELYGSLSWSMNEGCMTYELTLKSCRLCLQVRQRTSYDPQMPRPVKESHRWTSRVYEIREEISTLQHKEEQSSLLQTPSPDSGCISQDPIDDLDSLFEDPPIQSGSSIQSLVEHGPSASSMSKRLDVQSRIIKSGPISELVYSSLEQANSAACTYLLNKIILQSPPRLKNLDLITIWTAKQKEKVMSMKKICDDLGEGVCDSRVIKVKVENENGKMRWEERIWKIEVVEMRLKGALN